jgi:hypothetical protein
VGYRFGYRPLTCNKTPDITGTRTRSTPRRTPSGSYGTIDRGGEGDTINDGDVADADANDNTVIRSGNGSRGADDGQDDNDTSDENVMTIPLEDNPVTDGQQGDNTVDGNTENAESSDDNGSQRNDNDVVDVDINNNTIINAGDSQEGSFQLLSGESNYDLKYIGPNGRITLLHWSDVEVVDQKDS